MPNSHGGGCLRGVSNTPIVTEQICTRTRAYSVFWGRKHCGAAGGLAHLRGVAAKPKNRVPVGSRFGRYEIVKHLARGGMADLSIARASGIEGFERHVVLKHLRPEESEGTTFVPVFATE